MLSMGGGTLKMHGKFQIVKLANQTNVVNNFQKHVDELKENMMKMCATEPTGPAVAIASSSEEPEYQTDGEELAKEIEWIGVKHRTETEKNECDTLPTNCSRSSKYKYSSN